MSFFIYIDLDSLTDRNILHLSIDINYVLLYYNPPRIVNFYIINIINHIINGFYDFCLIFLSTGTFRPDLYTFPLKKIIF